MKTSLRAQLGVAMRTIKELEEIRRVLLAQRDGAAKETVRLANIKLDLERKLASDDEAVRRGHAQAATIAEQQGEIKFLREQISKVITGVGNGMLIPG